MTYHTKTLGFASALALAIGAAFVLPSDPAEAATINVIGFSTNGNNNTADQFAPDYGAYTPLGATWDDDPTWVVPPVNQGGTSLSPFSSTNLAGARNYFSAIGTGAPGTGGGAASPVTLTFTDAQNSFRLLWGSIDTYNEITFSDGTQNGPSVTVTGTDVASAEAGLSAGGGMVALVDIFDFTDSSGNPFEFKTAKFSSVNGSNSFEFALAPVPLPAAGLLLLGGLGGLGGLSALRRRKRAA